MAELTPNQIEVAAKAMFECCAEENIIMREHLWNQTRGPYRRMVIAAFAAIQPVDPRVAVVADELRGPHNHSERQPEHTAVRILAKLDAMMK